jgi:uncharacterized integral membrane protein
MALLHRDRTDTRTDTDTDTVAGAGTANRPGWPDRRTVAPEPMAPMTTAEPVVVRKNSVGGTVRTVLATALLVAVVLVAVANTGDVRVDLLFEDYRVSLALLVAGSAVAGWLIGLLMGARRRRVARL